jgi:hypothetical protein
MYYSYVHKVSKGRTMIMRRGIFTIVLFSIVAVTVSGCLGGFVRRQELEATARIAVASVVVHRLSDGEEKANETVLQAAVDHAVEQVKSSLAGIRQWNISDPSEQKEGKAVLASFGAVSPADLAAVIPRPEDQASAKETLGAELAAWKAQFLAAKGQPTVPREAFVPDQEPAPKDAAVRPLMLHLAGKLCKDLQVDAVVFAQLRIAVTHPRENAFIVTEGRTDGMVSMSATLVIVDKTGAVIADMGLRPIGEGSRTRDLLPVYAGAGKDAVRDGNVDLSDPRKKVPKALAVLVEESVADLATDLRARMEK